MPLAYFDKKIIGLLKRNVNDEATAEQDPTPGMTPATEITIERSEKRKEVQKRKA